MKIIFRSQLSVICELNLLKKGELNKPIVWNAWMKTCSYLCITAIAVSNDIKLVCLDSTILCLFVFVNRHLHSFCFPVFFVHRLTLQNSVIFHWFFFFYLHDFSRQITLLKFLNISRISKTVGTPKEDSFSCRFFHLHRDNALWALSGPFSRF